MRGGIEGGDGFRLWGVVRMSGLGIGYGEFGMLGLGD